MLAKAIATDNLTTISAGTLKLLVFEMGKLTLALPVEQVKKVIRYQPTYGSGLSHVSISHLGDEEITIVDLHQKLFKTSQLNESESQGYFVITKAFSGKGIAGEPLGIIVMKTPILLEVSLAQIRVLPNSYRHADTLEIASHVAIVPQESESNLTIFILDIDRLV
ncbi:CheW domain protein [Stanieria cyanosphaera PCC 7437]|uniref:CheW domain protein n=1 Tax=Stanieria cyanosphaera (strain ATCC 29371 / PCC 7437) TaxID=111780 RepID=K9Y0Q0_STAC7|nr:chemotaxis protein CheW [Stanieria cyanosphaera]AFZ37884.1 CheW domain protein [Stanieria cyanosphaera PCC 7437]